MKKHAFLILAHKQPKLLKRIVKVLAADNHYFFIHIDKKVADIDKFRNELEGLPNVQFITDRVSVFHAGVSELQAEIRLLETSYADDRCFDFFHLISGQDYPLRSNEQFDAFFEESTNSYMHLDDGDFRKEMQAHYASCINEFHFNNTSSIISRVYEKFRLGKIISLFYSRPKIANIAGGWDWYSWNRRVVAFVLKRISDDNSVITRLNHTSCAVELIFATLLWNHLDELGIEHQRPLRYISWHPHRPVDTDYRPYDLNELDYEYVIDSEAFFCRKVDEVKSGKLLDMIDAQRGAEYDITQHHNYV